MNSPIVECYSGFSYPDRPAAVWWQGQRYEVQTIAARWRTPDGYGFRVITPNGQVFELFYNEREDAWSVAAV